jgi:hypothetical protein
MIFNLSSIIGCASKPNNAILKAPILLIAPPFIFTPHGKPIEQYSQQIKLLKMNHKCAEIVKDIEALNRAIAVQQARNFFEVCLLFAEK